MTATKATARETNVHASTRELLCGGCGYGIVVRRDPPECPVCRASSWRAKPGFARRN